MTVKDIDRGWKGIVSNLKMLNKGYTKVGIQQGVKGENTSQGELTIADYATWNEFGTSNIPSRPFMRDSFDKNKYKIYRTVDYYYSKVLAGGNAKQNLGLIGEFFQKMVVTTILTGSWVPNAPSTIRQKRNPKPTAKQKLASPQPLRRTGDMIGAINHVEVFK